MTKPNFAELGLATELLDALRQENYETPTPIQSQAIPPLLEGRDLLGVAQTGTGKTAAFVLPILQRLSAQPTKAISRRPQALILAPTRELAIQIGEAVVAYGQNLHLRHAVIFGGVGQGPQIQKSVRGVHILVATPGRLLDLVRNGHIYLDKLETLVLDEADRMLDMGFIHDIRKIMTLLPEKRQSVLLSATMPRDIERLARNLLSDPLKVAISPKAVTVERIEQYVYFPNNADKFSQMLAVLEDPDLSRVIVFTRTKHRANRVAEFLAKNDIAAEAIHGNKSQGARQKALKNFREGETRILVATDIAARGIDIDDISHVINFELPNEPANYVHRIGRTARAGSDGVAISFCSPDERPYLRDIEHLIKRSLIDAEHRPFMANIPKKPKTGQRSKVQPSGKSKRGPGKRRGSAAPGGGKSFDPMKSRARPGRRRRQAVAA